MTQSSEPLLTNEWMTVEREKGKIDLITLHCHFNDHKWQLWNPRKHKAQPMAYRKTTVTWRLFQYQPAAYHPSRLSRLSMSTSLSRGQPHPKEKLAVARDHRTSDRLSGMSTMSGLSFHRGRWAISGDRFRARLLHSWQRQSRRRWRADRVQSGRS